MNSMQTIARVAADLRAGKISSVELTQAALARITDPTGEGSWVFTRVYADAVEQAAERDRRRARGEVALLPAGVPLSIKDLFDVAGETTLAGSRALVGYPPADRDAEVVAPEVAPLVASDDTYYGTNLLVLRNPAIANFLDRCALSLPCSWTGQPPVGLMLMGEHGADRRLLNIGLSVEKVLAQGCN